MTNYYRIYGKLKEADKFYAFNYWAGGFALNLIDATYYNDSQYDELVKAVKGLNKNNPDYIFEIRKV